MTNKNRSKTLLDIALDHYDRKATIFYRAESEVTQGSVEISEKRQKELQDIKRHLEIQRKNAVVIASIQAKLDAYQEEGRRSLLGTKSEAIKKQNELLSEAHHPTDTLESFMLANANPKPCPRHSAHHIVPGKGYTQFANLARVHLHTFGIRINDPDNGVWLPKSKRNVPLWSMPNALSHRQYHTHKYEMKVASEVTIKTSEKDIRRQLRFIGKRLQINQFPQHPEQPNESL